MLKNASLLAVVAVHTAENGLSKVRGREIRPDNGTRNPVPFCTNFGKLDLGCIHTSDSESGRIFQHFSRSTRLTILCTA